MSAPIPTAVLGATGYVGGELLRLTAVHPEFQLAAAVSESRAGQPIAATFAHLAAVYADRSFAAHEDWLDTIDDGARLALFSAAPHGASAAMIANALERAAAKNLDVHVVDVSADFRYAAQEDYEAVYRTSHGAPALLADFQSGIPEHVSDVTARHVGHPGCFATAVLLAAVPVLASGRAGNELFVSGITGSTGSGRSPQAGTHHPERHSNLYAYKALAHRHAPEITALAAAASGTKPVLNFVPHSGPFARGIYVTLYAKLDGGTSLEDIASAFDAAYGNAPFIDLVDGTPRLKSVVASNRAQIGLAVENDTAVVMVAIDNLVKGAAGGAMQWMNRLFQLPETTGLEAPAPAWT